MQFEHGFGSELTDPREVDVLQEVLSDDDLVELGSQGVLFENDVNRRFIKELQWIGSFRVKTLLCLVNELVDLTEQM